MSWQDEEVTKVVKTFREFGEAPNMCVLLLKDGSTEKMSLATPEPSMQSTLLQTVREVVHRRRDEIREAMLMLNASDENRENLLALIFETPRKLTLRQFEIKGKKLVERKHNENVTLSVGLYEQHDYGVMYG